MGGGNGLKLGIIGGVVLLIFILPFIFAGCRGEKCTEGSSNWPDCQNEDEEYVPPKQKIEIEFWNLYDEEKVFKGMIQAYQSMHSEVDIKINYTQFTNEEQYEQLLLNKFAEGEGPDIFAIHHSWLPKHINKISPMPEDIMTPDIFRNIFFDVTARTLIREDSDYLERIYGIPMFVDTLALYYNKKIFRNIKPDGKTKPAETWEEIKAQIPVLTDPDKSLDRFKRNGIAMGRADNIRHAIDILMLLFAQEELSLYDETQDNIILTKKQETSAGKNSTPAKNALSLYTSFEVGSEALHENWNQFITALYKDEKEMGAFVRNKTAMIFGYSGMYEDLKTVIEAHAKESETPIKISDIGVVPAPQFLTAEDRDEDQFAINLADFYPLTVSRTAEYRGTEWYAWEFLNVISGEEGATAYYQSTHKPSALISLIDNQKGEDIYGPFAQQVQTATILPILDKKTFTEIFLTAISKTRRQGVAKVLDTAEKQLQCLLDQIKEKPNSLDVKCTEL